MFWGKNIKVNETVDIDTEFIGQFLTIQTATLKDCDNSQYYLSIISKNDSFKLCCLNQHRIFSIVSSTFTIEKGMKLKLEGGKKGFISLTGFVENVNEEDKEEDEEEEEDDDVLKEEEEEEKDTKFLGNKTKAETEIEHKETPNKQIKQVITPNKQVTPNKQQTPIMNKTHQEQNTKKSNQGSFIKNKSANKSSTKTGNQSVNKSSTKFNKK